MARPCNDSRRSWRKRPAAGGNGEGKAEGDDDDPSGDLTTGVRVERSSCDKGKDDTGRRRRRTTDGDGGSETTEPELSAMAAPSPLHWGREPSVAAGGGSRGSGERGGADCAVVTAAAAATAEVVITAATPPRADMMLLNGHQQLKHDEAEVKLLPNACLGKGSFGRVVAGVYRGQKVAVKVLAEVHVWGAWAGGPSDAVLRSFAQEVEVLGRCCHPNVVRLLAACLTPPRLCLVMELMDASLEGLLYEQRRPASAAAAAGSGSRSAVAAGSGSASSGGSGGAALLPLPTVLHIGLEIAKGLEYLHPTIVHRDLKPANVLLNNPWSSRPIVKITDFGVSRLRSTAIPTNTPQAGTPAYLAPEGMYCKSGIITHQADIYSLAVLLWEMLSGERPWRHFARGGLVEIAFNIVARGWRLPLEQLPEARCPPRLRHLIRQCWDADPRRRPAAAEVAKSLALLLQEAEHLQTAAGASSSDPAAAAATAAAAAAAAAGEQLLAAPPKALAPASAAAAPQTQQHLGVAVAVAAAAAAPAGDTALGVGGSIDGEPAGQGVFDRVLEAKMHLAAIGEYCSLTSSAAEALGAAHRIGAETISLTAACFRPVQDAAAAAAPKPAETHGIIGGPHNHHNRHNHLHEAVAAAAAMDATPLAATSSQAAAAAAGASSIVLLWSMTTGGTVACLPTADC
ncbi:hypothetical protein PLESTM_002041900 [Pleodorina starrii]|nr:hypothetical protein PLESTM_002041900 [Pleodorina starrii]